MVVDYKKWLLVESDKYYHNELNPLFWDNHTKKIDPIIRRKLIKIAQEFYSNYNNIYENIPIEDIQLTGSLSNYNYTDSSDLDLHILVDFSKIDAPKKIVKTSFDGLRFIWNSRYNIILRGHEVEIYVQDVSELHNSTGIYSLLQNEWIKKPRFIKPNINDSEVQKKYNSFIFEIEQLEKKLIKSSNLPSNSKDLFNLANKLKSKIMKSRKEALEKKGEYSAGNLVFKKLRNNGYIGRLIDIISRSYERIYNE